MLKWLFRGLFGLERLATAFMNNPGFAGWSVSHRVGQEESDSHLSSAVDQKPLEAEEKPV